MSRRFEPRSEKPVNTAAVAPVMPADPKPKPDQIVKKIYIRQQPKAPEFYGVPRLALWIILGNCAIWLCGLVSLFVGRAAVIDVLGVAMLAAAGMVITLAIQFAVWKMYWWLLALSFSLGSLALIYAIIAVATGRIALQEINLVRF